MASSDHEVRTKLIKEILEKEYLNIKDVGDSANVTGIDDIANSILEAISDISEGSDVLTERFHKEPSDGSNTNSKNDEVTLIANPT